MIPLCAVIGEDEAASHHTHETNPGSGIIESIGPVSLDRVRRTLPTKTDYYVSLLVSCLDIAVSLGALFQWIASIDDRLYFPLFNESLDERQVFGAFG